LTADETDLSSLGTFERRAPDPARDPEPYSNFESLIQSRMRSRKGRKIRPRNKILIAILEACRTPSVEHWIMIKARLGYETFWMHTNRLLQEGKMICSFGDQKQGGKSKTYYSITEDGLLMLDKLRENQE
jgi:predicted transcriptional regulator